MKLKFNYKKMNKAQKIYAVIFLIFIVFAAGYIIKNYFIRPSIEQIKDSVVKIEMYDYEGNYIGSGSGFCAYQSDLIITNYHVVSDAYSIKIVTDDHYAHSGNKVIAVDSTNDLAIVQTSIKLKPLKLGSSSYLKTGKKVTTVGSPKGELNTVSVGIISNANNSKGIQIDAPISQGSSGGVLLDNKYRVIGVTYLGILDGNDLGYAISIDKVEELKRKLDMKYSK